MMCKNAAASRGAISSGPSARACRRTRMPPVRAMSSMSISTAIPHMSYMICHGIQMSRHVQISVNVWTHIGLKGSSGYSATAMRARMTASDKGTLPDPMAECVGCRSEPISTTARMSLMTCSFSTVCLLSRQRDLSTQVSDDTGEGKVCEVLHHVPVQVLFSETSHGVGVD